MPSPFVGGQCVPHGAGGNVHTEQHLREHAWVRTAGEAATVVVVSVVAVVVGAPLVLVAQDSERGRDLFELGLPFGSQLGWLVAQAVGVEPHGQLFVRLSDLGGGRVFRHAEDVVVVCPVRARLHALLRVSARHAGRRGGSRGVMCVRVRVRVRVRDGGGAQSAQRSEPQIRW